MDNTFRIPIVAVDQATAVVRKVNASFATFTKPVAELRKSVASFSRETGLTKLGQSAAGAAKAAGSVASQVGKIVTPLAAIAGIGVTASIVEMTRAWVDQGAEIARTSRIVGIYQSDLQSMRGAARMFGVDAGTVSSSLSSFGDAVQGALFGRNQDALAMLGRLGVGIMRLKDGSIDTVSMMKKVADSNGFQKANAETKRLIASTLGLSGMLPVMLRGSAGIERYQKEMEQLGAVQTPQAIAAAEQFAQSQTRLGIAFDGVRNRIVDGLLPVFQPIIDHTTEWLAANRELIGTKVDYYARRIADGIKQIDWDRLDRDMHSVVDTIKSVVGAMGGLKWVAIGLGVVLGADLLAGVFNLGTAMLRFGGAAVPFAARSIVLFAAGLEGVAMKSAIAFDALAGLSEGIPIVGVAMRGLSSVFLAFGATLEATPIGWIITGVAALAFAGYELYEHWSEIGKWWHGLWGGMSDDVDKTRARAERAAAGPASSSRRTAAQTVGRHFGASAPAAGSAAVANLPAGSATARAREAMAILQSKGWSKEQAAGIVANLKTESQMNPGAVGDNGAATGMAQWHKDRADAIAAHFGKPVAQMGFREQLDAVDYELRQGREQPAGRKIAATTSAAGAGQATSLLYERPADVAGEAARRGSLAQNLFSSAPPMAGPYQTLASTAANQNDASSAEQPALPSAHAGPGSGGAVIEVVFRGAPAGMTADVKGPGASGISVRVEHAMTGT